MGAVDATGAPARRFRFERLAIGWKHPIAKEALKIQKVMSVSLPLDGRVKWRNALALVAARGAAVALILPLAAAAQEAKPLVSSAKELGPAINRCWRPPAGTEGWEVTLRFMLTHTGAVRGKPMITYSRIPGALDLQKQFIAAAIRAVADCTPLNMAEAFSRGFGERLIAIRLQSRAKQTPL